MLDGILRKAIDPPLNMTGRWLAARGADAETVTLTGLAVGLLGAAMLAIGLSGWIVAVPLLLNRLLDGLDGAVARATEKTDFGGYLDLCCDFLFYGAVPLAFVIRDPAANGVVGAFLLLTFYVNGATFLGYATLAAKAGMVTAQQGEKSLYYAAGLLEGTETILFFMLLVFFPWAFVFLGALFGLFCLVTAAARLKLAWQVFAA